MQRGVIATAVTALAGLAMCCAGLTACHSDPVQADPTPPPISTSGPATTAPTTTPVTTQPTTPAGPTLPALARQPSLAGAKAFVRFYVGAINSSIKLTSSRFLRAHSTRECVTCRGIASSMDKIRRAHGFYRGGDWVITSIGAIPLQPRNRPILHTAITVTPGAWKRSPSDHLRKIKADKMYVDVHVSLTRGHWIVTSIVSAS